jgi:Fe2+ or Zn2+ uptake regulation protein
MSIAAYPKRRGCYVTPKQLAILKALARRNPDGTPKDIYQLIDECAPGTVRGSMICSLRHLAGHGLIEEAGKMYRRKRMMQTYVCTPAGLNLVRPAALPGSAP